MEYVFHAEFADAFQGFISILYRVVVHGDALQSYPRESFPERFKQRGIGHIFKIHLAPPFP